MENSFPLHNHLLWKPVFGAIWPCSVERNRKLSSGCNRRSFLRFTPSVVMGYYMVTTTTVSEFVAAMEKIHVPAQITIPMSVMFRFFPTVAQEWSAIGDAMRMRGIRLFGHKANTFLEYRIIPMMICSVKIGEELSQAALTRGLGGPVKRTNICTLGFHWLDILFLFVCFGAFVVQMSVWF